MAITIMRKTITSMQQLATWLSENAVPDYFASVTFNSSTNATDCKDSENHTVFSFGNSQISFRKSATATETISNGTVPTASYPASVGKCANGILITIDRDSPGILILITKTNNGEVAAVFNYSNSSNWRAMCGYSDVHVAAVGDYGQSAADIKTLSFTLKEKNQTQLVQFTTTPAEGTISYTPKAYYMPCTQGMVYDLYFGKFLANGKWYLTNGYWAIVDEEE